MDEELRAACDCYVKADVLSGEAARKGALPVVLAALDRQAVQLLDIVVYLEKPLSDPDAPQVRCQAIVLLVQCLKHASELRLNFKHVETLARFFASKLGDRQCVEGALGGILALLLRHGPSLRSLQGGDDGKEPLAAYLARRLFKEVSLPRHPQQVRMAALEVVHQLLQAWREEVSVLGPELGEGVAATIEEERDPRNLLMSFNIARQLLQEFDPSCVSSETLAAVFETLTSYFPITFQPPKDDKYGITGDHLQSALNRALSASPRFADLLVPFLLDNTKDISVGDNDGTIADALDMLSVCLEAYGPELARAHIRGILFTARDQVCRTTTPCPAEFCSMVRRVLAVALRDVPAGLHPHWLTPHVDPALKALAADAAESGTVLASGGSRRLLLAAAAAHPVLLQRVWTLLLPALLGQRASLEAATAPATPESPRAALPLEAMDFVAKLTMLADAPPGKKALVAVRQLKPALHGALETLRSTGSGVPQDHQIDASGSSGDPESQAVSTCLQLIGHLCCLVGEEASSDAFRALTLMLLPPVDVDTSGSGVEDWALEWRRTLSAAPRDPRLRALLAAVQRVLLEQPPRAMDLAAALLAPGAEGAPAAAALPQLLASAALGLARRAVAGPPGAESPGLLADEAAGSARELLSRAAALTGAVPSPEGGEAAAALAEALESTVVPPAAASWAASRLAEALLLPADLARLCGSWTGGCAANVPGGITAARSLVRALSLKLPSVEARALRCQVLRSVAGPAPGAPASAGVHICVTVVPSVLPCAAQEDWELCSEALSAICRSSMEERQDAEATAALEALQAIVQACPQAELESLLQSFRRSHGHLLEGGGGGPEEARGAHWAVRCWAAAAAALLRRGGCALQAASLLEALLGALEGSAAVARRVPLAFQVLMPPRFRADDEPGAALPPLALQQLSLTMLPPLVRRTRAEADTAGAALAKRAALESAVALLCALPAEFVCSDCDEELRWCTLTSLSRLKDEAGRSGLDASSDSDSTVFAAQVLQLLVRATLQSAAWIEDELHSIVSFLAGAGSAHHVPLVRLGSMQALLVLVQRSRGHLAPFRKQIEAATRRGVDDRRREVRLVAVACLNTWHCGTAADG